MQCLSSSRAGSLCARRPFTANRPAVALQRPVGSSARTAALKTPSETASQLEKGTSASLCAASVAFYLLSESPALADAVVAANPFDGVQANSLYVTMALFLMCVPGIWSQVKRAPKAAKKRKVFEVDGPGRPGAMTMDDRARQVFSYFKNYNYEVKGTGEVITFSGLYAANKGQAAAVTFYTFFGLGSIALVLATLYPDVGNWWYSMTLLSPGAWFYYYNKGTRTEEVKVKMVTADDDQTTDIIIEGDPEEITRFSRELKLVEKGMVYVKGILEQA